MSDDNRDQDARRRKEPARSGSIPGPVYDNPNESQSAASTGSSSSDDSSSGSDSGSSGSD